MKVGRISVLHLGPKADVMNGRPRGGDVRGSERDGVGREGVGYLSRQLGYYTAACLALNGVGSRGRVTAGREEEGAQRLTGMLVDPATSAITRRG